MQDYGYGCRVGCTRVRVRVVSVISYNIDQKIVITQSYLVFYKIKAFLNIIFM